MADRAEAEGGLGGVRTSSQEHLAVKSSRAVESPLTLGLYLLAWLRNGLTDTAFMVHRHLNAFCKAPGACWDVVHALLDMCMSL